ncbi:MAG: GAF domain-containing protein [Burkholderiaceae bacterium]
MFDTDTLLQSVADAATGHDQPARGFAALDHALRRYPGHKLFTILVIDWAREENQRIYTSAPDVYPCGGMKPLRRDSAFFRQVVSDGHSQICRDRSECRAAFFDHELIERLGCESAINVPIRSGSVTLGSLNLLHEAGWYTPDMIPVLTRFASLTVSLLRPNAPIEPS